MSKNKTTLVPHLRFPEFAQDGEWEEKKLGGLCEYWNGSSNESNVNSKGKYFLISLNSIDIDGNLKNEMKKISNTDNSLKKGDIVMVLSDVAHGNFLGLAAVIPSNDYVLNQRMAGLRVRKADIINNVFLRLYINNNQKYFKKQGQGSSQQNLSKTSVLDFPINFPQIQEQQKIAACLSSLDALLAAHSQKLERLQEHKKGLLQNLFPQDGEKIPRYRFPEFAQDGDWEEKKLGEIGKYENGKAHEKEIVENGKYIVVNSKFISTNGEVIKYSNSANCLANSGDILMVLSDVPNGRAMAKCFLVNENNQYTVNQRICKITAKHCDKVLLYYIMDRNLYFLKFDDGVKQTNLRKEDVLNFTFLLPNNFKEQQKIASCLSALDALITAQEEKIEQLEQHKKGLMQGVFPNN